MSAVRARRGPAALCPSRPRTRTALRVDAPRSACASMCRWRSGRPPLSRCELRIPCDLRVGHGEAQQRWRRGRGGLTRSAAGLGRKQVHPLPSRLSPWRHVIPVRAGSDVPGIPAARAALESGAGTARTPRLSRGAATPVRCPCPPWPGAPPAPAPVSRVPDVVPRSGPYLRCRAECR